MSEIVTTYDAIQIVKQELIDDPRWRLSFQDNIACAILDTKREKGECLADWRNRCAEKFLLRLCNVPEFDDNPPGYDPPMEEEVEDPDNR